jgi:hypothetical protein
MLSTKERQIFFRLRRVITFLSIIIFLLFYWIRVNYSHTDYLNSQLEISQYEIIELEGKNNSLLIKIDSINKTKVYIPKKTEISPDIKKIKETKKDSLTKKDEVEIEINSTDLDTIN